MVGTAVRPHDDSGTRAIQEIFARSHAATSTDGQVTVWALGDATVSSATVREHVNGNHALSRSATEAVQESLRTARAQTAAAIAELPDLNPQLRALLRGEVS